MHVLAISENKSAVYEALQVQFALHVCIMKLLIKWRLKTHYGQEDIKLAY